MASSKKVTAATREAVANLGADETLNAQQEKFCQEYVVDFIGYKAAIRAGYSERTSESQASALLSQPKIQRRVGEIKAEQMQRTHITPDMVVRRWWELASADPRELVEHKVYCCRHCWGQDFKYEYTPAEWEAVNEQLQARIAADEAAGKKIGYKRTPNPKGGVGYNANAEPNPDCPECNGKGHTEVVIADTRHLSPGARALYAGVKQTRNGVEVLMHSQENALVNLAKHLGMFTENLNVKSNNTTNVNHTVDEETAVRIAQEFLKRHDTK